MSSWIANVFSCLDSIFVVFLSHGSCCAILARAIHLIENGSSLSSSSSGSVAVVYETVSRCLWVKNQIESCSRGNQRNRTNVSSIAGKLGPFKEISQD
ncbi:hypothetical protein GCK32_001476 [Trichostrongylus colubriformis]|uniref:Secreted protein n=1 Tax=Trichostrongylus colubriformis TaxID=6319 RepID=A0AAN8EW16_TRICO